VGGPCSPKNNGITYPSKMDTDLYQLVKNKTFAIAMCVLPKKGTHVFVYGADNRIRIFHHATGTVVVKYDERLAVYDKSFAKYQLDAMDYGKRAATEREMATTSIWKGTTIQPNDSTSSSSTTTTNSTAVLQRLSMQVDPSGKYLLLPTLLGVKVIDWQRNKLVKILGKSDASQLRFLGMCLCYGDPKINRQMQLARGVAAQSSAAKEKAALQKNNSDNNNKNIDHQPVSDALVITLAYDKRRFYVFSHVDPLKQQQEAEGGETETNNNIAENDPASRRDIWNEPPTLEDRWGMRGDARGQYQDETSSKLGGTAILRTTMGDVHIKLFPSEVPKTIENFVGHAKSGYYDNVIFHRCIKGFMIQTGDPLGDGTGGESIWGGEFEDEFVRDLRHDRPFTVSMANAGANTNGSQFFITTVPTPWLDNKHTVFGRVTKGMDVCLQIENAKTDDGDKPLDDIKILSIDID
jgi:peptidylprolyl isomerase domain and WD repeat-containing protein 1